MARLSSYRPTSMNMHLAATTPDFVIVQIQGINENIHQQTLIIFGEKDPLMEGVRLFKGIRQSRFSVIPSATLYHFPVIFQTRIYTD
jgi:pimeloyl-ACP methyl ester carboxylesterase